MPPASKAVEFAQQAEADGFDAIWWPCHLMGWTPDSVWTEDLTALAKYQANPHQSLPPADDDGRGRRGHRAHQGRRLRDGHDPPPSGDARPGGADRLAISRSGRAILGLGSGERMNIAPYGMEFHKPVGRLEEAIRVIRLLWAVRGPGRLRRQLLQPQGRGVRAPALRGHAAADLAGRARPAHAAHQRRAGRRLAADQHQARRLRREARRDPRQRREGAAATPTRSRPSMLAYVICAPDEETLERMCDSPLARLLFAAVDLPAGDLRAPRLDVARSRAARASTRSCRRPSRREEASGSSSTSRAASCASTRLSRHAGADRRPDPRLPGRSACATSCSGTSRRSPTRPSRSTRSRPSNGSVSFSKPEGSPGAPAPGSVRGLGARPPRRAGGSARELTRKRVLS